MDVRLSAELSDRLATGLVELSDLTIHAENTRWDVIEEMCRSLQAEFGHLTLAQIPGVEWARKLFSSVGIDPTKHRPSSEALLRRAIKGEPLHQVNTLVDAMNWCSLEWLLPIGLYDVDKIHGRVTLRLGAPGESYQGIGRGDIHLAGRLAAADDLGVFGSPISDSLRTAITADTRRAMAIIFAPAAYPEEDLAEAVEIMAERSQAWCGGDVVRTDILRGAG